MFTVARFSHVLNIFWFQVGKNIQGMYLENRGSFNGVGYPFGLGAGGIAIRDS
jgi:hypothetical protein